MLTAVHNSHFIHPRKKPSAHFLSLQQMQSRYVMQPTR